MTQRVKARTPRRRDPHRRPPPFDRLPTGVTLKCAAPVWPDRTCRTPAAATVGEPGHEYTLCEKHLMQVHVLGLQMVLRRVP